ncbi:hypothetical protein GFL54_13930 [Rhizobium laguerreae]|nr:hypothetical protein [Rhizobium laguerreae]NKN08246.1 hypothetical protein [Rhizobium laguerreae]
MDLRGLLAAQTTAALTLFWIVFPIFRGLVTHLGERQMLDLSDQVGISYDRLNRNFSKLLFFNGFAELVRIDCILHSANDLSPQAFRARDHKAVDRHDAESNAQRSG